MCIHQCMHVRDGRNPVVCNTQPHHLHSVRCANIHVCMYRLQETLLQRSPAATHAQSVRRANMHTRMSWRGACCRSPPATLSMHCKVCIHPHMRVQDGGDPAVEVSPRDIVYTMPADQASNGAGPQKLAQTDLRYAPLLTTASSI